MNVTLMRRPEPTTHETLVTRDRPWPETAAGAIVGALVAVALAFTPFEPHMRGDDPLMWVALGAGAVIGAGVSWWLNANPVRRIDMEREVEKHHRAAA